MRSLEHQVAEYPAELASVRSDIPWLKRSVEVAQRQLADA